MTTFCEDCLHVIKSGKDTPPYRWTCDRHRRVEGRGFVTREFWDRYPPRLFCVDVNGGECVLFEQKPETENE